MHNNLQNFLDGLFLQPFLVLLLFICSIFFYKWFYTKSSATYKNLPPSPPKLPILGNLHQLGTHPHWSLKTLSDRYGELMLIQLGQKPTLVISSAKMAKEVMKTHDSIVSNRPKSRTFSKLFYESRDIATSPYGEYWRQTKSIFVLKLVSTTRVRSFRVIREEESDHLVEKIKRSVKSEVNLSDLFIGLTNDVICRAAFGRKYRGNQTSLGVGFAEVLKEFVELAGMLHIGDMIPWLSWVNRVNGVDKRLDNVAKKCDMILDEIINQHLIKKENSDESEKGTKDFVDVLLEVQKEEALGFSMKIVSKLLYCSLFAQDAFAGGTDTTYTVLEWTMTELLRHPKVLKKLQQEVRGITKGKEQISEDELEKMKYLKAVLKETLRLHPPIPLLIPRETEQEMEIDGYHIAPKTRVIVNTTAIHRDETTWEVPNEFRPERFLCFTIDFKGQDFELIPFGGGRRICPGISFAMSINELVVAKLVNTFNWSLPEGVDGDTLDMSESTGLTMHRKIPLFAIATLYKD